MFRAGRAFVFLSHTLFLSLSLSSLVFFQLRSRLVTLSGQCSLPLLSIAELLFLKKTQTVMVLRVIHVSDLLDVCVRGYHGPSP